MTATTERQSAEIIQFPARGRFAARGMMEKRVANSDVVPAAVSYGSWYHDDAIQEAKDEKSGKN
jgi:hypothetical protein